MTVPLKVNVFGVVSAFVVTVTDLANEPFAAAL